MTPFGKGAQDFAGEGGVTVAKGISGKAHTSKVADGYTQAGQYDEAIKSMVTPGLEAKRRQIKKIRRPLWKSERTPDF